MVNPWAGEGGGEEKSSDLVLLKKKLKQNKNR